MIDVLVHVPGSHPAVACVHKQGGARENKASLIELQFELFQMYVLVIKI